MTLPPNKKTNKQTVDEYLESIGVQKTEPTTTTPTNTTTTTTPTTSTTPSWSTVTEMAQNSATTPSWADPNAGTTTTTTTKTPSVLEQIADAVTTTGNIISTATGALADYNDNKKKNETNAAPATPPVYRPNNQTIISGNTGENEPNAAPKSEEEIKDGNGNTGNTNGNTGNGENNGENKSEDKSENKDEKPETAENAVSTPSVSEDFVESIVTMIGTPGNNGVAENLLAEYGTNVQNAIGTGNAFLDNIMGVVNNATAANTNNAAIDRAIQFTDEYLSRSDAQANAIYDAIANTPMAGSTWDDTFFEMFGDVLGQNMAKSDTYSQNIYGNTDYMRNLGTELMDYIKGYNPLETDWGKGILDYYGVQSGYASNTANSEGAANNAGNVDSYAAANAERQRLDTLGQGVNALSGLTTSRFENLLNAYNSTGSNITNLLGLEGLYNLPFATDQLNSVKGLAEEIYKTDAQSVKDYNNAVANLLGLGNDNVNNTNTALSTIAGLGESINDDQVNAQNDLNSFISALYQIGGESVLPFLEGIINGQGTVGTGIYNTDAASTANLYNFISSMFGGGTSGDTSGTETPVTLPSESDLSSWITYYLNSGEGDGLNTNEQAAAMAKAFIDAFPAYANNVGYFKEIFKDALTNQNMTP